MKNSPDELERSLSGIIRVLWDIIYTFFSLGLALLLDYVLWYWLEQDPLLSWLIAINLIAVLTYSYDQIIKDTRIPPLPGRLLLLINLIGGSIGALLGIWLYRHKTGMELLRRYLGWIISSNILIVLLYVWLF